MPETPPIFQKRISEHNRHCWGTAVASFFAAWLAWMFYAAVVTAVVLLFEVVRTNDVNISQPPFWFYPGGIVLILGLILWAGVDRWRHRFRPVSDRPIIGWHLIPEVIFLPARLTFAIGDHLGARVKLSGGERREAWHILRAIWQMGRADASQLGRELSDPRLLSKLLPALQLTDWIDFHSSEGEWYYRVRTDQEDLLRELLPDLKPAVSEGDVEMETD